MVTACTGIACGSGGACSPDHATIRKQAARPAQSGSHFRRGTRLLIQKDHDRTTLAKIVARARGSLATVYKLFSNKDGLLAAVIRENVASGETLVRDAAAARLTPAATLRRIAEGLHERFLEPEVIALVRIVIARSINEPQFARQFFERTANQTRDAIAALFTQWQSDGVAMNGTPQFLAEMFMGLFVSDLQTQAISHGAAISVQSERLHNRTDFFLVAAKMDEPQPAPCPVCNPRCDRPAASATGL